MTRIRPTALLLVLVLAAAPLQAAGFDEVANALESQLGRSTWIPFFGLARTFIRATHPDGVHDIQLAVFEGKGKIDGRVAAELMASRLGSDFRPMVRSRSKSEWSYIYARPAGRAVELMILSNDGDDTVLVRVVADPEVMNHIRDEAGHHKVFIASR